MASNAITSLRLEKVVEGKTLYVTFDVEAQNRVIRRWNVAKNGLFENKNEKENLQSAEQVQTYLGNMRAAYEKQGFKVIGPEPVKAAETTTLDAGDLS